jgi:hypothetical protein
MSCNCQNVTVSAPDGGTLPLISDVNNLSNTQCTDCGDNSCENSNASEGSVLPNSWLDACCHTTGVTILGRVGDRLARFAGSGFLQLTNGKFSVVQSFTLKADTLWHRWWKPTAGSRPIIGEPLAYPHLVISDSEGSLHSIKGPDLEDAIPHWNATTKEFTNKPISEIPVCQKGLLPRASALELTGYAAIPEAGPSDQVRCMATLEGVGLLWADAVPTVDTDCECAPTPSLASVVTTLPFPDDETAVFTLKYSLADGLYWQEDA